VDGDGANGGDGDDDDLSGPLREPVPVPDPWEPTLVKTGAKGWWVGSVAAAKMSLRQPSSTLDR